MDLPQPRVSRVREGHARGGEVAVCRPIQRSNDGQRDKLGKLPPGLVVPADWSHSEYSFTEILRDLEVNCFVRRSRIPRQELPRPSSKPRQGRKGYQRLADPSPPRRAT